MSSKNIDIPKKNNVILRGSWVPKSRGCPVVVLYSGVAKAPEAIHPIVTGGAGYKMSYLPIWGGGSQMVIRRL